MTTETKIDLSGLYVDAIDAKPQTFDWSVGYGERWETVEPELTGLSRAELLEFAEDHGVEFPIDEDYDPEDDNGLPMDLIDALRDNDPDMGCPMMNYRYPLSRDIGDHPGVKQRELDGLPVCLVQCDDEYFLALTGGGMDLSWEICEAYIIMGYLPPLHFAGDLPIMAGMQATHNNLKVIAAARKAVEVQARWHESHLRRINEAEANLVAEVTP